MQDCSDISLPLSPCGFQDKYIPLPCDFNIRYPDHRIEQIRKAFATKFSDKRKVQEAEESQTTGGSGKKRAVERSIVDTWVEVHREFDLFPGYILNTSENKPDAGDKKQLKVDATLIADSDKEKIIRSASNWALSRLPIEFKRGGREYDPFDDREGYNVEATAATRRHVRGQLMSYAGRVCSYQHRTKLFQLLVNGEEFRMLRWDRGSVAFTSALNYLESVTNMRLLLQLLYGFTMLDDCSQGLDHTAVPLPADSCGWKRMDVLSFHHNDLSHDERRLPKAFTVPTGFTPPTAEAPHSPLFNGCHLYRDPMAILSATDDYAPLSLHVVPVWTYVRRLFRDSLDANYPRYQITVNDHKYLVGRPVFENHGMVGRGTRGYVALEWETQRLVFLKDAWRPFYVGVEKEGDVLAKLNKEGTSRVPTLINHGDVYEADEKVQETETSKFAPTRDVQGGQAQPTPDKHGRKIAPIPASRPTTALANDASGSNTRVTLPPIPASMPEASIPSQPLSDGSSRGVKRSSEDVEAEDEAHAQRLPGSGLRHFVHYRIVVAEVCLPSTAFLSGRMWARIVWHCLQAHQQAYEKCSIIHRDISVGNILILPTLIYTMANVPAVYWSGVLTDWELAKDVTVGFARQPERTGTWQFMPLRCIKHPSLPVSVPDELESCFQVLLYNAVRFLLHNLPDVHSFVTHYFDNAIVIANDVADASPVKHSAINTGRIVFSQDVLHFEMPVNVRGDHPMNELIRRLLKLFCARYRVLEWEETKAAHATQAAALPLIPSAEEAVPDLDDQIEQTPFTARPSEESIASGPTAEDFEFAESLKTHHAVVDIFAEIVQTAQWPKQAEKDVVDDRLFGYRQPPRVNPLTKDKPSKQAKTAPVGGPSSRWASAGRSKAKLEVLSE
ncbi:hypothetical protein L226DRAFT_488350 [Lentinus tigrinus ALCF2SS1-7]|uniref:Fungal-type protein kinase domain-containing protein n=1 Tax=Lentinus tigrinus ALCF2SS1-6 TaxID=1328759 RepID=A0A5C2RTR7_9APHY|nr:hypothetical protein L227DRAFT_557418 [Lentinus tigrinus ALCF2SS1-6]RPD73682.1 hypothetical protein L226DRAFT_488350 [Lentinus tigrinus ALCF2SS1-7]